MSKSVTVTGSSAYNTVSFTLSSSVDSLTITGSSFNVNSLLPTAVTITVGGYFFAGSAYPSVGFSKNESNYSYGSLYDTTWTNSSPTRTMSLAVQGSSSTSTSNVFNSQNPTEREVTVYYNGGSNRSLYFSALSSGGDSSVVQIYTTFTLGQKLILDVPPTFKVTDSGGTETTQVYFDTNYVYAGLTTASIKVGSLSAKYGGDFTGVGQAEFTIGNQTVTKANPTNGDELSILLNAGGTFRPTVTVTDSRGQTTTKTLDDITVNVYDKPSVSFDVERTLSTGKPDDEGTYAVINPTFTFTDVIATLSAPTVTVTDQDGTTTTATPTWYSSRAQDGTLSGSVTWANLTSPATVYGLISGFNTQYSYQIAVTPEDSQDTGTTQTQTLGGAYYTVDFLAGGHGIAFGKPASNIGFECAMDATFVDANGVMRALFDFIYPVGSYYETSDTAFDPNVTWGGTWTLETEGLVHIGAGANYTIGDTGGSKDAVVVSHTHDIYEEFGAQGNGAYPPGGNSYAQLGGYGPYSGKISTTGVSGTGMNMQPYIVVNRWHRTA